MKAVFLDRDGVINENRTDHVCRWSDFRFLPGSLEAISRLTRAGIAAFVITNQAIINRGVVSRETVDAINDHMTREIERAGGRIQEVAYCPHRPDEECGCRKPRPGLLHRLAGRHGIDLAQSVLVGDALSDIEAGRRAGCQTILVLTGRGRLQLKSALSGGANGFWIASDLNAAISLVLQSEPVRFHSGALEKVA